MAATSERNIGQRVGWTAKVGGASAAAVGLVAVPELFLPGAGVGLGGWALEKVSTPRDQARMASGGSAEFKAEKRSVLARAADIYLRAGAQKGR